MAIKQRPIGTLPLNALIRIICFTVFAAALC